jgi:hypothetical protein
VAQTAGVFSGGTACNGQTTITIATFNSTTLSPGDVTWICGIINQPAGGPGLDISQSGTSANPIVINFDTGAVLEAPYWGTNRNSAIYLSNQSYITINGGNTTSATGNNFPTEPTFWTSGVIQNYANGSSGTSACPGINNVGPSSSWTSACSNTVANTSGLITATDVSHIIIENLRVGPVIALSGSNNGALGCGGQCQQAIQIYSDNILVTNNQLVWAGEGVDDGGGGTYVNVTISHNYFTEDGWGIALPGPSVDTSGMYVDDNWMSDWTAWVSTGTHLNGVYSYNCNSSGGIPILYLWNNVFYGNTGASGWTAWVHLGNDCAPPGRSWTDGPGLQAWNNLCVVSYTSGNGCIEMNGGTGNNIWNNTLIQTVPSLGGCAFQGGVGGGSGNINQTNNFQNNVIQGYGTAYCFGSGGIAAFTASNNVYGLQGSGSNYFQSNSINTNSLSSWQSACGCDAGSAAQLGSALAGLTNYGFVSTGFMGIGAGANLSNIATGNLASLEDNSTFGGTSTPVQRTVPWTVGAYQMNSGTAGQPPAPENLTASVQ